MAGEREELLDEDFDVEAFVNEEYPTGEPEPAPVADAPETEPEADAEPEPAPVEESKDLPADKLPPDFKVGEKAEEKPEDTPEDVDLAELDKAIEAETNPDKKSNMAKMRTKIQAQEQELAELRSKPPGEAAPEEVQTLKSQLDEAHETIGRLDLKESPKFKAKYDQPYIQNLAKIADYVKDKFDSPEDARELVDRVARMNPIAREEFLENNVPKDYRNWVSRQMDRGDEMLEARAAALRDFEATKQNIGQESVIEEQQRTEQYRTAMKQKTLVNLKAQNEHLLEHQPGNDTFNAYVDGHLKVLDQAFASNDPAVQADLMTKGVLYEPYKQMFLATQSKVQELQAQLDAVNRNNPKFNGGDNKPGAGGKAEKLGDTESILNEIMD